MIFKKLILELRNRPQGSIELELQLATLLPGEGDAEDFFD
jgi:hypothetical protein